MSNSVSRVLGILNWWSILEKTLWTEEKEDDVKDAIEIKKRDFCKIEQYIYDTGQITIIGSSLYNRSKLSRPLHTGLKLFSKVIENSLIIKVINSKSLHFIHIYFF